MNAHNSLVFRIDPKLLQHRPPRLTLAATLEALRRRVEIGELNSNLVIDILDENRLLPYIIGDTKNLNTLSLGQLTNASKIGDIIVSEECIRGTYELCLAFLGFILTTVRDANYTDTSRTMLASITYIANEIYPNHHIWTYRSINDMNRILYRCTEIFHQIIVTRSMLEQKNKPSQLEIVCVINMSQNQAHRQLLDVIVDGKQSVKKVIAESDFNGEQTLRETPIVICTRQSLIIFNKLLSTTDIMKGLLDSFNSKNSSGVQNKASSDSSTTTMTNIEHALFDTSIRPGLLQHLFSYIYLKDDSCTACLAVELIKKIAEKFTMSLMASLGSEADRVCEFFIKYLGEKESNIDLEIAILDLLSTCVKHQPGLIELFLNFERDSKSTSDQTILKSLQVVLDLLRECRSQQSDAYRSLHSYVMKFILTFWKKCHSAIEQFDKADKFWESIAHPLVKFLDTDMNSVESQKIYSPSQALNDKLNSYSLMILAREIFNVNAGINERKMNVQLKDKLDELHQKNLVGKYSAYLTRRYSNIESNLDKSDDYIRILCAWRDFLASCSKYKPFDIDVQVQNQIVEDMLKCLTVELQLGERLNKERCAAIGETLLLIWMKWMPKDSAGDEIFNSVHTLLYLADTYKEYLPFSFLLTFQSTLNLYLMRNRDYLINSKRSFDLLVPALQMMQFSLKIMEKHISNQSKNIEFEYKPGVESRLCQASIMTLRFIIDGARPHVGIWISYLQTNLKTDSLVQFLTVLMSKRAGAEVCLSVVELLLSLSSINESADYLNKSGLINQVNMIAVSAYERPYAHLTQLAATSNKMDGKQDVVMNTSHYHHHHHHQHDSASNKSVLNDTEKRYLDNMNSNLDWLPIYQHVIRLNISMILTLGNDYMSAAVEFLSIHCIRICEIVELLRTRPRSVNLDEALQLIYMINLVLRHGCMWTRRNSQSYLAISDEIAKTAYTLATSALPPPVTSDSQSSKHTSLRPKDCLIYARCCYDFSKYTEAERVLFQTKFGDKNGFIKEAPQIYGDKLSNYAFHLAALICLKTNRQLDSIDFALQVFSDDPEHFDILTALTQNRD